MINLSWDDDYELADEDGSVYVYVGKQCVVISRNSEGTVVDIYERGFEDRDPLGTTYAMDCECTGDDEVLDAD